MPELRTGEPWPIQPVSRGAAKISSMSEKAGKRPVLLSITHNFCSDDCAQFDIGEARHAPPHNLVAGWRIAGAGEIAAEPGDFDQVV